MAKRWLGFLLAALAIALVVTLEGLFHWSTRYDAPFRSLLPETERIVIQERDETLTLTRSGPTWAIHVASGPAIAGDPHRIQRLSSALHNLLLEEVVTPTPSGTAAYGLQVSSAIHVSLFHQDGHLLAHGLIGRSTSDRVHFYFQKSFDGPIYFAKGLDPYDLRVGRYAQWRARDLVPFAATDIRRVKLQTTEFLTVLEAKADGWHVNGVPIPPDSVAPFLVRLTGLRALDFDTLGPDVPAKPPFREAVIDVSNQFETVRLRFGAPIESTGRVPVQVGEDDSEIAWIATETAAAFRKKPGEFTKRALR